MAERLLYFDCFSGLAGDMTLGAMLDLGLDATALREALSTLDLPDWHLEVRETRKMGIRGIDATVVIGGKVEGPSTDTEHHHHNSTHGYDYCRIRKIITDAQLPPPVREGALSAFKTVGEAEAKVHGCSLEDVHFHEVGAVDSVVDIVAAAWGLWKLGIDEVHSAPPPMGRGFIRCAHGRMPLPAPATLEILRGVPICSTPLKRELVTPTGAAFIKAWAQTVGEIPEMQIEGIGWGAGDADFEDRPNLLRLIMGQRGALPADCQLIETNVDDMTPEVAGFLLEKLFEVGALDAWFVPIQMKKNRPGLLIGALATPQTADAVESTLLTESTAIGLRRFPVSRRILDRRAETVHTPFGPIVLKVASKGGSTLNVAPEFESCAAAARRFRAPIKTVYQHAIAAWVERTNR